MSYILQIARLIGHSRGGRKSRISVRPDDRRYEFDGLGILEYP